MDDAAKIINDAAARRQREAAQPRVHVGTRQRNPYREIRAVEMDVPPCPAYPSGKTFLVHPKQVEQHKKLFPGAHVVKVHVRKGGRPLLPSGVRPVGHGHGFGFLKGRKVD